MQNSDGSYNVPDDWPLVPSGFNPGDRFRLLFITNNWRDASSTSISTYDTHIQTQVASGHTAIRPYSAQFKVVGSTSGTDARDHVGATGTGVPIYWMGGSKVADDYTDFWDGNWDNNAGSDRRSSSGQASNSSTRNDWPWTGTNNNGTKHSNPLGSATPRRGAFGSNSPLSQHSGAPNTQTHAFYGLSPVFVVRNPPPPTETAVFYIHPVKSDGTVELAGQRVTVSEDDGKLVFRVQHARSPEREDGVGNAITFNYCVIDDRQSSPGWHVRTRCRNTATLPAGQAYVDVEVPVRANAEGPLGNNGAKVILMAGNGYITRNSDVFYTIKDGTDTEPNEISHTVSIRSSYTGFKTHWTEGEAASFEVRLDRPAQVPFTVHLKVEESGGGDFVAAADEGRKTVRFKHGQRYVPFNIPMVNDGQREPESRVTLRLTDTDGNNLAGGTTVSPGGRGVYTAGTNSSSGRVVDVDPLGEMSFGSTSLEVQEDHAETVNLTVNFNPPPTTRLVLSFRLSGTATLHEDYTFYGGLSGNTGLLLVRPGTASATIPVKIRDDHVSDDLETVVVRLTGAGRYKPVAPDSVMITIRNHDPGPDKRPVDALPAGHPLVTYGFLVFDIRNAYILDHDDDSAHTKWKRVLKALGDEDYADYPRPAMTAAEAKNLYLTDGWDRWAVVSTALTYAEKYFSGTTTPPPAADPEVTIAAGDGVTEGTSATFTLTADPAPSAPLDVSVTVATEGDYVITAGAQTVTIPTTGSTTLTLATTGDETDEADGSVSVTVDAGTGYTVGDASSGSVAIADDDDPAPETGTAHPAVDPALIAQIREWMAAPGANVAARNERFTRVLAAFGVESHANPMTVAEAEGYVRDGWGRWQAIVDALKAIEAYEPPTSDPEVTIAAGDGVTEGGSATFTLTADPTPAAPLDVTVTVATDGAFGITAGTRTVTIPTTGSATLTLATTGDEADEADGSVSVTVDAGSGYTVGDASSGTVAIADDDAPPASDPEVTIAAGSGVTEGTAATFTLTANPAPSAPLDVTVTVATDGDYGITAGTQTVTIPTTGSATLTLATTGDDVDEADGSVSVTVDASTGYTVGDASSGTVAIADDDLPPPAISVTAGAGVTEGGDAVFTVKADRAVDADLAVTLTVSEKAGSDFVAAADEGGKTVTVLASQTEATLTVKTVDDAVDEPDGSVTAAVDAGTGYTVAPSPGDAASVAVADNDAAAGPPVISVEDVTVREGGTAMIPVRLAPAPTKPVRLFYKTMGAPVGSEGYASWADFKSARAWLNFRPGETLKHVRIKTVQDSHDDGGEWFEVFVISAQGHAVPAAGVYATVTIENDDPMPGAYLARFGRTVAEQALEGIAGRMSADRTPGMQGTVAGQALTFDPAASGQSTAGATPGASSASGTTPVDRQAALAMADIARGLGADASAPVSAAAGPVSATDPFGDRFGAGLGDSRFGTPSLQSRTMTARDALLGSSFSLTGQRDGAGGSLAFWGRASQGSFDGAERGDGTDIRLDGTVTTGMLGADYARGNWLIGLALTQSSSEGSYAAMGGGGEGDSDVEASLTAAIPYAALLASERLKLWGAAGHGTGEVTLKTAMGEKLSADTSWTMAAAGVRGDLLEAPTEGSGPALALTSDALWARTSSDKTGELAATDSDVTRLRLGLEGSYRIAMEGDSHLTPKLEIGARHDGGDAETGFGVEVGGGIAWVDPSLGLSLDLSGRTLLAHENDDLEDRGFSASLGFDPAPATQRGPSFSLRQDFGGQAQGGLDALFVNDPLEDRAGSEATSRWAMEAAYGLPVFGGRFTGSPHVGLGLATGARDYSLGWRLTPEAATALDLSLGVKATRQESDTAEAEYVVGFEAVARW